MQKVTCEKMFDNQVWKIILNDPKGNVVDSIMLKGFQEVLDEVSKEKHCKLIIFQGAGSHFSFGVSVEEHTEKLAAGMLASFHDLFIRLTDLGIPVCSLISGQCLGGGVEIATFAHFVFADETARIGQSEVALAVFAPPASVILPLKVGHMHAEDILLTGRSLTAQEAKQMGLLNEVYPDKSTMEQKVNEWIQQQILPKSAFALKVATKQVRKRFNERLKEDLRFYESVYMNELMKSHDGKEGLNAFLEKRKPVWTDD
ncbi:MAG: enoyl-CoA hydratase/isomerase family protein [Thermodesulfobacteriota bacterium]|jgi:cyclohexa-1,5-dienecarbonyl-CoA hydratase|nr:MAG: enoyl-CoA hydratase/isomerase family protein [Thermodesulfobacteriota bacterium]